MLYENLNRAALYKLHVTGAAATRSINVIASDANNGVTHQTWKKEKETEITKTLGQDNYLVVMRITMELYANNYCILPVLR